VKNNNESTPVTRTVPKPNEHHNSNSKIHETPDVQFNNYNTRNSTDATIPKSEDGSLLFYWYDAHEEINNSPYIILFGKTYNPETSKYHSLSVVIRNLERKIYLLPKLSKLKNVDSDDSQVLDVNKDLTFAMFQEFEEMRKNKFSYIKRIQTKAVVKKYCFELPIPHSIYRFI
jgi:DNA polymerase alpha subunit A